MLQPRARKGSDTERCFGMARIGRRAQHGDQTARHGDGFAPRTVGLISDLPVQGVSDSANAASLNRLKRRPASRGGRNRQVRELTHTHPLASLANDDNLSLT